ncbi:MAG: hypothetical protein INH13_23665, partial [Cupriavidus sp.]|nr:hypothetical protein [Cupriavidus sp.]
PAGLTDQAIVELARRPNIHTVDGWNIFVHERHAGHAAVVQFAHAVLADFLDRAGQYVTNDASREAAIADALAAQSADASNAAPTKLDAGMLATIREAANSRAEGAITQDGRAVFINYGDGERQMTEAADMACPHCGGSGHKDDVPAPAAQAEPFGFASPTQGNYFTRNKTIADRIGGLIPVYASPQHQSGEEGADARDAAAYRRINTPEITDFLTAVHNEALHQRERWGAEGDAGKTDADWFWLLGYLGGKAMRAENIEKLLHHIITTAAACLNWHAARVGHYTDMRPGIDAAMADQARKGGECA